MLVAPKYEQNTSFKTQTNMQTNIKTKKVVKVSVKFKLLICSLTLLSFILGIAFTSLTAQVAAKGQELNSIKKEIGTLQTNIERLQLEKQRLTSLENIKEVAITELGMIKPQFESLQMVTVDNQLQAEYLLSLQKPSAENEVIEDKSRETSETISTAVVKAISNWAVTGKQ